MKIYRKRIFNRKNENTHRSKVLLLPWFANRCAGIGCISGGLEYLLFYSRHHHWKCHFDRRNQWVSQFCVCVCACELWSKSENKCTKSLFNFSVVAILAGACAIVGIHKVSRKSTNKSGNHHTLNPSIWSIIDFHFILFTKPFVADCSRADFVVV